MQRACWVFLVLSVGAGCAGAPDEPIVPGLVVARHDLSPLGDRASPVGVTIDPLDGIPYVLLADGSLFRLEGSTFVPHWSPVEPTGLAFTDIAALGGDRFALTAVSDGYLLDVGDGTLANHFCYEPGDWDPMQFGPPAVQVSQSVAYDGDGLLYAQPRTVAEGDPSTVFMSQVASFDRVSGDELTFWDLADPGFEARGLAVQPGGRLVLGAGSRLHAYARGDRVPAEIADLATEGITRIEGLALSGDRLFVIDGPTAILVELDLEL